MIIELVSVNEDIDVWKINYTLGIAKLIDDPNEIDSYEKNVRKIKKLNEDIESYLSFQGLHPKEKEDWYFIFDKQHGDI